MFGVHPVREALVAGRSIEKILIATGAGGPRLQEIIDLARGSKVPVRFEPRPNLERAAPGGAHQGVVAYVAAKRYGDLQDLGQAELVIVLDGVEDPHNLGAIIRTAHAAGAGSIIIPERRAAGLTETVAKASAGALEHMKIIKVNNINRTLDEMKEQGYWIYGVDQTPTPVESIPRVLLRR